MFKICQFKLSDLEKVTEIAKKSFPENRKFTDNRYLKKYFKKYPTGFFIAKGSDKKIAGYAIGYPKKKYYYLFSIAVHPDFRQKGIGKKLINFLLDYFKKKGLKKFSLHVRTCNKPAVAFHQNTGFKIAKTVKKYYRNGDDAYFMKLKT